MDLRGGKITVGEVLRYPGARELMQKYFPRMAGNALALSMAKNWTMNFVMEKASGRVAPERLQKAREELEKL